ncbi:Structure-specific endonuclease subunit SLX4, partial [Paramuricea clavata]
QNRQFEKQQEQISGVIASDMIHEIFNHPKPTKAQMRAAAITIQRYFRGWFVRKSLKTVKERALKRTFSFNKFIKSYQDLVYRIQKRYNIEHPHTALQFHELQEYVDRLFKYEIAFGKIAESGTLRYEDILKYFAECGHHPSEKEVDDAIAMVTKDSPKGRNLTKSEAVEVVFQIYIPKGTGLTLADVRKSTWMNPLIDGQDVKKILSKKDLKFTSLDKVLNLVADSQTDRNEVKELLRAPDPQIMNVVEKTQEELNPQRKDGKQKPRQSSAKSPGGGNFILARGQYQPVKPSESKQNKKRRPVSGRTQK